MEKTLSTKINLIPSATYRVKAYGADDQPITDTRVKGKDVAGVKRAINRALRDRGMNPASVHWQVDYIL